MNKTQFRKAQQQVYAELQWLDHLQYVGGALVDFIYHLSPDSILEHATIEWVLRPRNWVALRFIPSRRWHPKVEISIDIGPYETLNEKDLIIKPGRYRSWRKFTMTNVSQLAASLRVLTVTHQTRGLEKSFSHVPDTTFRP